MFKYKSGEPNYVIGDSEILDPLDFLFGDDSEGLEPSFAEDSYWDTDDYDPETGLYDSDFDDLDHDPILWRF